MSSTHQGSTPSLSVACVDCIAFFSGDKQATVSDNNTLASEHYQHSENVQKIYRNAEQGCCFCSWLARLCRNRSVRSEAVLSISIQRDARLSSSSHGTAYTLYGKFSNGPRTGFEFSAQPATTWQRLVTPPFLLRETNDSPQSKAMAKMWFDNCLQRHKLCSQVKSLDSWLPSRLIEFDLSAEQSELFRVVHRSEIRETGVSGTPLRYVALSHRWGENKFMTLNENTKERLTQGVSIKLLPLTFQHAIAVCRWFGYRHLWIDSLCIQQDSHEDWEREAHTMKMVYSNAILTVASAAFEDSEKGFFVQRAPASITIPIVETSWNNLENNRFCLISNRIWSSEVEYAPVSRRAWVMQERALSSRTLYFSISQMFYECCEISVCESLRTTLTSQVGTTQAKLGQIKGSPRGVWYSIAEAYTRTALSRESDRVIAIAGVAEKAQTLLADEYIVGLWKKDFLQELMWENSQGDDGERDDSNLAPSWSWLSLRGALRCARAEKAPGYQPYVKILKIDVCLANPDYPTGNIRSASLQLEGVLKPAEWKQRENYSRTDFRRYIVSCDGVDLSRWQDDDRDFIYFFHVDVIPDTALLQRTIFLLPCIVTRYSSQSKKEVQGLMIVPKQDAEQTGIATYVRVGQFKLHLDKSDGLFLRRRQQLSSQTLTEDDRSSTKPEVTPLSWSLTALQNFSSMVLGRRKLDHSDENSSTIPEDIVYPSLDSPGQDWERIPPREILLV